MLRGKLGRVPGTTGASSPGRGRRRSRQAAWPPGPGAPISGPRRARVLPGRCGGEIPPSDAAGIAGSRRMQDDDRALAFEPRTRVSTSSAGR
ncbi:hypothetical protein BDA96_01G120100 [Sorghum bicolor]|uniref:Uncharacterized protein n=2 Tax=Sorghum bicolor TaxID=4558 RepID=A0A921UWX1_SORBI|nr:hypothetical protein BDA96_01G120100 [Sorghum bicolor]KXG37725.2 hypothetical protein SORBI_3001G115001 [Sorghum bicolor]